jgi:isopentenyl diphosphate isomerase/L-lactate dehydrogenase-like FMN-dependent dehydrogenase
VQDGGIRRGRDVLKALLSGADAVLLALAALAAHDLGGSSLSNIKEEPA